MTIPPIRISTSGPLDSSPFHLSDLFHTDSYKALSAYSHFTQVDITKINLKWLLKECANKNNYSVAGLLICKTSGNQSYDTIEKRYELLRSQCTSEDEQRKMSHFFIDGMIHEVLRNTGSIFFEPHLFNFLEQTLQSHKKFLSIFKFNEILIKAKERRQNLSDTPPLITTESTVSQFIEMIENSLKKICEDQSDKTDLEQEFGQLICEKELIEETTDFLLEEQLLVLNPKYIDELVLSADNDMLIYLEKKEVSIFPSVFKLVESKDPKCNAALERLIEGGLSTNFKKPDGSTLLSCAIENKNYDLAELLIFYGANPIINNTFRYGIDSRMKQILYFPKVKKDQEMNDPRTDAIGTRELEVWEHFNQSPYLYECYALFIKVDGVVTVLFRKAPFWHKIPTSKIRFPGKKIAVWRSEEPIYKIPFSYAKEMSLENLETLGIAVEKIKSERSHDNIASIKNIYRKKDSYDKGFKYATDNFQVHGHAQQSEPAIKFFIQNKEKAKLHRDRLGTLKLSEEKRQLEGLFSSINKIFNEMEKASEIEGVIDGISEFLTSAELIVEKGFRNMSNKEIISAENMLIDQKFSRLIVQIENLFRNIIEGKKKSHLVELFDQLEDYSKITKEKIQKSKVASKADIKQNHQEIKEGLENIKNQIVNFGNNASSGPIFKIYTTFSVGEELQIGHQNNIKPIKVAICNLIMLTLEEKALEILDEYLIVYFEKETNRDDILKQLDNEALFLSEFQSTSTSRSFSQLGANLAFLRNFSEILKHYPPRNKASESYLNSYDATLVDCVMYYKAARTILDHLWMEVDLSSSIEEQELNKMVNILTGRARCEEFQYQVAEEGRYPSLSSIPTKHRFDQQLFVLTLAFFISLQRDEFIETAPIYYTNLVAWISSKCKAKYGIEKEKFPFKELFPSHLVETLYEIYSIFKDEIEYVQFASLKGILENHDIMKSTQKSKEDHKKDFYDRFSEGMDNFLKQGAGRSAMLGFFEGIHDIRSNAAKLIEEKYQKIEFADLKICLKEAISLFPKPAEATKKNSTVECIEKFQAILVNYEKMLNSLNFQEKQLLEGGIQGWEEYKKQIEALDKQDSAKKTLLNAIQKFLNANDEEKRLLDEGIQKLLNALDADEQKEKYGLSQIKKNIADGRIQVYELMLALNKSIELFKSEDRYDPNAKHKIHSLIEHLNALISKYKENIRIINVSERKKFIKGMDELKQEIMKFSDEDKNNFKLTKISDEMAKIALHLIQPNYTKLQEEIEKLSLSVHEICYYTTHNKTISHYAWNNMTCDQSPLSQMNETHIPLI